MAPLVCRAAYLAELSGRTWVKLKHPLAQSTPTAFAPADSVTFFSYSYLILSSTKRRFTVKPPSTARFTVAFTGESSRSVHSHRISARNGVRYYPSLVSKKRSALREKSEKKREKAKEKAREKGRKHFSFFQPGLKNKKHKVHSKPSKLTGFQIKSRWVFTRNSPSFVPKPTGTWGKTHRVFHQKPPDLKIGFHSEPNSPFSCKKQQTFLPKSCTFRFLFRPLQSENKFFQSKR